MKNTLEDFWEFLKRPAMENARAGSAKDYAIHLFRLLLLDFGLLFLTMLPITILGQMDLIGQHKLEELLEQFPLIMFFFLGVIIAPVLEEAACRLYLRYSAVNVLISLALLIMFFTSLPSLVLQIALGGGLGLLLLFLAIFWLRQKNAEQVLKQFWTRHFYWIYYASAVIFGLAHLTNFEMPVLRLFLLAPLLVLPQMALGLILGYVRIRQGILSSIIFHAMHNGILMIPLFFSEMS